MHSEKYLQKNFKQLMSNTQKFTIDIRETIVDYISRKISKPENLYFEKVHTEIHENYLQKECKQLMSLTRIFTIKSRGTIKILHFELDFNPRMFIVEKLHAKLL